MDLQHSKSCSSKPGNSWFQSNYSHNSRACLGSNSHGRKATCLLQTPWLSNTLKSRQSLLLAVVTVMQQLLASLLGLLLSTSG
jgi:hypothetical protein